MLHIPSEVRRDDSARYHGRNTILPLLILLVCCVALPNHGFAQSDNNLETRPAEPSTPCDALNAELTAAIGDAAQAAARINLAQCLLVTETVEPLGAILAGSATPPQLQALKAVVRQVKQQLVEARLQADAIKEPADIDDRFSIGHARLRNRIDLLSAFAEAFAALAREGESPATKRRLIDACIGLSIYVDDSNQGVVESARLWQAVGYRKAGRDDRVLHIVRPVLSPTMAGRAAFWARIERSRALADQGQFVAALALVTKLGGAVPVCLASESEQDREMAANTVRALRIELLESWAESARSADDADLAERIAAQAIALKSNPSDSQPASRWLPLSESIEGLSPVSSAAPAVEPAPESQPAAEPAADSATTQPNGGSIESDPD